MFDDFDRDEMGMDHSEDSFGQDCSEYEDEGDREPERDDSWDNYTDAEADADTLASAGWGTDEDYGHYGEIPEGDFYDE